MSDARESEVRQLRQSLPAAVEERIDRLQWLASVTSTNSVLMEEPSPAPGHWRVVVADEQTAGRGRGGNDWYSPPGGGLWMSAAYCFETKPDVLSPMTLALGVCVADELRKLGVGDVGLKWPNDIVADDRKLGGLLVETASASPTAVIGVGINFEIEDSTAIARENALAPVDLASLLPELPSRAVLAAALLARFADAVPHFEKRGLTPFLDAWQGLDWLAGKRVDVLGPSPRISGVAAGIGRDGALIVRDGSEEHRVLAGTVRLIAGDA